MPEVITIYAASVEDISPVSGEAIEITLADVDLAQFVSEFRNRLLDEFSIEEIKDYLEEKESEEGDNDD